jgi:hypothetical protein
MVSMSFKFTLCFQCFLETTITWRFITTEVKAVLLLLWIDIKES